MHRKSSIKPAGLIDFKYIWGGEGGGLIETGGLSERGRYLI